MIAWEILPLSQEHICQSVELHQEAFPGFFLSYLGPAFLHEFYISFLQDQKGVGFVAQNRDDGTVLGVIVGPVEPEGYFRRLIVRRWWAFSLASVAMIVRKPSNVFRLIRAIFYRGNSPPGPPRALLSSIAVLPKIQTRGIGRALVDQWMTEVRRRGATGCYLATDADNNMATEIFYQKLGWHIETSYLTPEGRRMHCYIYDFN